MYNVYLNLGFGAAKVMKVLKFKNGVATYICVGNSEWSKTIREL